MNKLITFNHIILTSTWKSLSEFDHRYSTKLLTKTPALQSIERKNFSAQVDETGDLFTILFKTAFHS